jgi:hypothetical protein
MNVKKLSACKWSAFGLNQYHTDVMSWEFLKYAPVTCWSSFFSVWQMVAKEEYIDNLKNDRKEVPKKSLFNFQLFKVII